MEMALVKETDLGTDSVMGLEMAQVREMGLGTEMAMVPVKATDLGTETVLVKETGLGTEMAMVLVKATDSVMGLETALAVGPVQDLPKN
jgi:hypothetical protein